MIWINWKFIKIRKKKKGWIDSFSVWPNFRNVYHHDFHSTPHNPWQSLNSIFHGVGQVGPLAIYSKTFLLFLLLICFLFTCNPCTKNEKEMTHLEMIDGLIKIFIKKYKIKTFKLCLAISRRKNEKK